MADVAAEALVSVKTVSRVVNHESGIRHGNEVVRIPEATGVNGVQRELHEMYAAGRDRPCASTVTSGKIERFHLIHRSEVAVSSTRVGPRLALFPVSP